MKKSILTAAVILMGVLPVSAFAAECPYADNPVKVEMTNTFGGYSSWSYSYDSHGNLTREEIFDAQEPDSKEVYIYLNVYDGAGKLTSVDCKLGSDTWSTLYQYDSSGNLTTEYMISDYGNAHKYYSYNSFGQLVEDRYVPDAGDTITNTYTYSATGKLLSEVYTATCGDRIDTTYTYNASDDLIAFKQVYSYGQVIETAYTLNRNGQIAHAHQTDSDGYIQDTDYTYDVRGRVLTEKTRISGAMDGNYAYTYTYAAPKVVVSNQNLMVNGKTVECEKYNIDGANYFKLRDLAYLISGTGSQFGVGYDQATNTVTIETGKTYIPNGTELVIGTDESKTAVFSRQTILIDGSAVSSMSVYNIGGSNYFKLRDLGDALGFDVDYDAATRTAIVNSH